MRKLLASLASLGFVGVALAEGEGGLTTQLATEASSQISSLATAIGPILIAAFGIAVAFVAYKLIKRAIGKA